MSPLWGPLCPYIHSTVAFLFSHMWIRKSGRLLMGSSTRGSWGGKYIQPMMNSPSTWMKNTFNNLKWSTFPAKSVSSRKLPHHKWLHAKEELYNVVVVPYLNANVLIRKHYVPQRWAIHHKALCQAATSPRYVCKGEALQRKSTTTHHTYQFLQCNINVLLRATLCNVRNTRGDVKTHRLNSLFNVCQDGVYEM